MTQKLSQEEKEKLLLNFLKTDVRENGEDPLGTKKIFNEECAKYFYYDNPDQIKKDPKAYYNSTFGYVVQTDMFNGTGKHLSTKIINKLKNDK